MDGFDAGDVTQKWSSIGGGVDTTTRFSVGRSIVMGSGGYLLKSITPVSKIIVGFALSCSTVSDWNRLDFRADGGAITHISIYVTSNGSIQIRRAGTALATSASGIVAHYVWNYIECSATIHDSTGTVDVHCNGVSVVSFTGDTRNGGTSTNIDTIAFQGTTAVGNVNYIDDVYFCDDSGLAPYNTFLGDVRVYTLVPDAAGSSTQLTPSSGANYTTVDELPYSSTDYVSGTAGQTDLYSTANLPGGTGIIYGVQTNAIVKKTDAGNISGKTAIKSGATTYYGTTTALGTTDVTLIDTRSLDPSTSAAWTSTGVNNIEIGIGAV